MENKKPSTGNSYRYSIAAFDILFEDGKLVPVLPSHINFFSIQKDYRGNMFPVFNINIRVNTRTYYQILKEKTTVKYRVQLRKFYLEKDGMKNPPSEEVFNDIFVSFIMEDEPFFDEKLYEETLKVRAEGDNPLHDTNNELDLYLFKDIDLNNTKRVNNKVYGKLTMMDAMALLFTICKFKPKSLLITPFDNNRMYDEILFPPLNMLQTIEYLENIYDGFYNTGKLLFFDIDMAYLLDRSGIGKAFRDNEFKKCMFHFKDSTSSDIVANFCVKDDKQKLYNFYVPTSQVSIRNPTVVEDQVKGSNTIIIDPITGANKYLSPDVNKRGQGNFNIVVNNYSNMGVSTYLTKDNEEKSTVIYVNLDDVDMTALTPNKEYTLRFDNKSTSAYLNGQYRLTKVEYTFSSNGENEFNINAIMEFRK